MLLSLYVHLQRKYATSAGHILCHCLIYTLATLVLSLLLIHLEFYMVSTYFMADYLLTKPSSTLQSIYLVGQRRASGRYKEPLLFTYIFLLHQSQSYISCHIHLLTTTIYNHLSTIKASSTPNMRFSEIFLLVTIAASPALGNAVPKEDPVSPKGISPRCYGSHGNGACNAESHENKPVARDPWRMPGYPTRRPTRTRTVTVTVTSAVKTVGVVLIHDDDDDEDDEPFPPITGYANPPMVKEVTSVITAPAVTETVNVQPVTKVTASK